MALGKKTGGRVAGSRNKAKDTEVAALAALARKHTKDAIAAIVKICKTGQSEAAVISAAVALLDRGYGKPAQTLEMTGKDGGAIVLSWKPPHDD